MRLLALCLTLGLPAIGFAEPTTASPGEARDLALGASVFTGAYNSEGPAAPMENVRGADLELGTRLTDRFALVGDAQLIWSDEFDPSLVRGPTTPERRYDLGLGLAYQLVGNGTSIVGVAASAGPAFVGRGSIVSRHWIAGPQVGLHADLLLPSGLVVNATGSYLVRAAGNDEPSGWKAPLGETTGVLRYEAGLGICRTRGARGRLRGPGSPLCVVAGYQGDTTRFEHGNRRLHAAALRIASSF